MRTRDITATPRIAIGAIFTESNHLVGRMTTLTDFERTELRRGPRVLEATGGAFWVDRCRPSTPAAPK